ncbi:MAG TPA: hypothetical protein PK530_03235, partial [Anaerolineales bacterium]|nr:hypothetical protein [Anaerolineales bacterium]
MTTSTIHLSKWHRWGVVFFILLNLVISNFLVDRLPANVLSFILGMWSPALLAILFTFLLGLPFKSTLGLK